MTEQEINVAIAKILGWHHLIINDEYGPDRGLPPDENFCIGCIFTDLPNYYRDLNAMRIAEKSLSDEEWKSYIEYLDIMLDPKRQDLKENLPRLCMSATAAQLAEVFVQVKRQRIKII